MPSRGRTCKALLVVVALLALGALSMRLQSVSVVVEDPTWEEEPGSQYRKSLLLAEQQQQQQQPASSSPPIEIGAVADRSSKLLQAAADTENTAQRTKIASRGLDDAESTHKAGDVDSHSSSPTPRKKDESQSREDREAPSAFAFIDPSDRLAVADGRDTEDPCNISIPMDGSLDDLEWRHTGVLL